MLIDIKEAIGRDKNRAVLAILKRAFLSATFVLLVVSLLAAYIPARRAARVDPMASLQSE